MKMRTRQKQGFFMKQVLCCLTSVVPSHGVRFVVECTRCGLTKFLVNSPWSSIFVLVRFSLLIGFLLRMLLRKSMQRLNLQPLKLEKCQHSLQKLHGQNINPCFNKQYTTNCAESIVHQLNLINYSHIHIQNHTLL